MEEVSASFMSGEPCWRLMENWSVGPGRVWLKRPRSTGRPLVGGCTRDAELETASLSSSRASFHNAPYLERVQKYMYMNMSNAQNIIIVGYLGKVIGEFRKDHQIENLPI